MNTESHQVFISFKNLDADGKPTRDSQLAQEVHDFLAAQGLRVFFSNVSLEKLGVSAYKKAIDDSLDHSKVLIAVGTSAEHLDSQWVRYEWDSFFSDILSGVKPDGRIFVYIENTTMRSLPRSLRQSQVFSHGPGALERLRNFVVNAISKTNDGVDSGIAVQADGSGKEVANQADILTDARRLAKTPDGFWKAYDLFIQAIDAMPEFQQSRLDHNRKLNHQAYNLFGVNNEDAVVLLCEAVANIPEDMHSWQELGVIRFSERRFAEAEEFQERAIEAMKGFSSTPADGGRFWMNMANCRLHRVRTDSTLSEQERQAKLLKAGEEARFAIGLGEKRGHFVLQEITRVGSPSLRSKPWWRFW